MAGVKGGRGGPRPGAGRPPAKPRFRTSKALQTDDPDQFLRAVMRDPKSDFKDRMAAALALSKKSGSEPGAPPVAGKKAQQLEAARRVASGRSLVPLPPPTAPRRVKLFAVK